MNGESILIPKWLANAAGGLMVLVLPWAGWLTVAVSELNVKVGVMAEYSRSVLDMDRRVTALEGRVENNMRRLESLERK